MQLSVILVLSCALISELIKFSETYKPIKPYKFYNPHPWRPPRWHSFRKSPKRYRPERILPQKHHIYEPDYKKYAPIHEDSHTMDSTEEEQPYVIVIQLPRNKEKNVKVKYPFYQRQHTIDAPRDTDYIARDDNDDNDELKVYHIDNKTVRIKVNDRLSVVTS